MEIIKIAFTGGPCAGKTSIIKKIKKYLKDKNYKVIVVPETATLLKEAGINFKLLNNVINFQSLILKMQLSNEKIALEAARQKNEKIIILYDRGVLDNKAYCENYKNFDIILKNEETKELEQLDNYNMVFDLITTADCAPDKYTLKNNKQREESIEDAKILDKKTSNAWTGHRNLKIINSNISLEEVFKLVKKEIKDLIKKESKKEIKKYYIDNVIEDFYNFDDNNSRLIKVQQIHLKNQKNNINYNLYKRTYKDNITYIFKMFKEENNIITTYLDEKISFVNYLDLISKYKINEIIHYNQLSFIENRQEYNIKFYDNYTTIEYEENKLNDKFIMPECIKIINKHSCNKQLLKK